MVVFSEKQAPKVGKNLFSAQVQLNIFGLIVLGLLGLSAWSLVWSAGRYSFIPLALVGYAACVVVFELTFNRANVPSLATSLRGRVKFAEILELDKRRRGLETYRIVDLGSGRGFLTRRLARSIVGAVVTGIEIAAFPYRCSVAAQRLLGVKNLRYLQLDFWAFSCAESDAVVMYLTPNLAQKLGEKLERELRPGSLVASHSFPLLGVWKPVEVVTYYSPFKEEIFVYRKGE